MFTNPCDASPPGPRETFTCARQADTRIGLLVADSHDCIRSNLREIFARSDVGIVGEATTPQQVKRLLRVRRVGVLLLDVVWDREAATIEEGIRLLGDIRDAREDLSIIVYSVCESSHCINRCRQLGANGYLVKGEDDHALVSAVHIVYYGGDVWPDRRKAWHT